jgi:HisA/HisF family protein
MRVIPVIDLKGGLAVHAVRGERSRYVAVQSVLTPSAEPLAVANAFKTSLGLSECYVADLDAIGRQGDHADTIRALARAGAQVWLDAGISTDVDAIRAVSLGVARVIVGTETLASVRDLASIVAAITGGQPRRSGTSEEARALVAHAAPSALSLDLREGALLGGSPAVRTLDPVALASAAWDLGVRAFIVLELGRVGTGGGVEIGTARRLREALPAAEIVVGGGIRNGEDLRSLAGLGFDACLVATALHTGAITDQTLSALRRDGGEASGPPRRRSIP